MGASQETKEAAMRDSKLNEARSFLAQLTVEELRTLNKEVVARLRQLQAATDAERLAEFRIGQWVKFEAQGRLWRGRIVAINQRSISVDIPNTTGKGGKWRVWPGYLTPMTEAEIKAQEKAA